MVTAFWSVFKMLRSFMFIAKKWIKRKKQLMTLAEIEKLLWASQQMSVIYLYLLSSQLELVESLPFCVYSLAMSWPPWSQPTSWASWTSAQIPQHHHIIKSLKQLPSIPLFSRINPLIFVTAYKFRNGTYKARAHIKQLSPTLSAFLPNT